MSSDSDREKTKAPDTVAAGPKAVAAHHPYELKPDDRPWILRNLLFILTITAVTLGILIGCVGRLFEPSKQTITLIEFPGEMLMRMLKCIILPLIGSSLITGLAHLDIRHAGKMGGYSIAYYMTTTLCAIVTGIVLVMVLKPGQGAADGPKFGDVKEEAGFLHTILDLFRNIIPDNLVQATLQSTRTVRKEINVTVHFRNPDTDVDGVMVNGSKIDYVTGPQDGTNVIGMIVVFIAFGALLSQMGVRAKTMTDLTAIVEIVSMRFVGMIMWYAPVGIVSMVAGSIIDSSDLVSMLQSIGMYSITVIAGLSFHTIVTIPTIYFLMTRRNPFVYMRGLLPSMLFAFGCSSSAATLPVNFRCLEQMGIDRRVTRFVLPVGATINMDGTALYESVAAIFIANRAGMAMPFGRIIQLSLAATMGSIGAAAIPGGGIVPIILVLQSLELPTRDISLIIGIDWLMDRFQTSINVMGDAFGAGIVYHLVKDSLPPLTEEDELASKAEDNDGRGEEEQQEALMQEQQTQAFSVNEQQQQPDPMMMQEEPTQTQDAIPTQETQDPYPESIKIV